MIEVIKELTTLLKDLPDMAVYIMAGILFYKVFIIGSSFALAKYGINKLHDYLTRPKEIKKTIKLGDILCLVPEERLLSVLYMVPRDRALNSLHEQHVLWLESAIKEKIKREANKNEV